MGSSDRSIACHRGDEPRGAQDLDFHLGDGPNGIEAIGFIREKIGDVPAALITGAPVSAEMLPKGIELLRKPLMPNSLLDVLEHDDREP